MSETVEVFRVQYWASPLVAVGREQAPVILGTCLTVSLAKKLADTHIKKHGHTWPTGWKRHAKNGQEYEVRPFHTENDVAIMVILPGRVGGSENG